MLHNLSSGENKKIYLMTQDWQHVVRHISVFALYLSYHDGKGMVDYDVAQTASMAKTRGTGD